MVENAPNILLQKVHLHIHPSIFSQAIANYGTLKVEYHLMSTWDVTLLVITCDVDQNMFSITQPTF